jgi:hypothetical protein
MEILTLEWREKNRPPDGVLWIHKDDSDGRFLPGFLTVYQRLHWAWIGETYLFAAPIGTMKAEPDDLALVLAGTHPEVWLMHVNRHSPGKCEAMVCWINATGVFQGHGATPNEAIQSALARALAAWRAGLR